MLSPEHNSTPGIIGAVATAANEAASGPVYVTYAVGTVTVIYYLLKIVGWFMDRFGKTKRKGDDE